MFTVQVVSVQLQFVQAKECSRKFYEQILYLFIIRITIFELTDLLIYYLNIVQYL